MEELYTIAVSFGKIVHNRGFSQTGGYPKQFQFETPTGKRYSAHDVNLYKSVILMIAMARFVVVVVVVLSLSLSLFRNSKGSPRLRLRLRKTRRLFKVSFFRA